LIISRISKFAHFRLTRLFPVLAILIIVINSQSLPGETSEPDSLTETTDTLVFPDKQPDRKTWEWLLSSPGLLINLPFKIVLKGAELGIGYFYQPQVVGSIYDLLTSDDGLRALRPTYTSRSGAGLKLYQKDLLNQGSMLKLSAKIGLKNRQKYQIKFLRVNVKNNIYSDFILGYRVLANEHFYGQGNEAFEADKSLYSREKGYAKISIFNTIKERLKIIAGLSFEHNNILKGKGEEYPYTINRYALADLPGLENEIRTYGTSIGVNFDSRNSNGGPTSGNEISLEAGIYNQLDDDKYGFSRIVIDVKKYFHLFYGRTLIFRVAGEMTDPLTDKLTPFYQLSQLGTRETIRGFSRSRYRDNDAILGSIEYRYPIRNADRSAVDAILFVDAGQVAGDIFNDFSFGELKIGFGGGFRVWSKEAESIKFTIAKSDEQFRFYLSLNE